MKLVTFTTGPGTTGPGTTGPRTAGRVGVLADEGAVVVDLTTTSAGDPRFASMRALITAGPDALADAERLRGAADAVTLRFADVRLDAPLPDPVRLRDCSLFIEHLQPAFRGLARKLAAGADNPEREYERLVATGDFDRPAVFEETVIYYNADHTAVSAPESIIVAPEETNQLDYELEFAAVIGTTGRDVAADDARAHIFGYTIFNDWSARDLQNQVMASRLGPARGKDFDGSNTLGPCIVTTDELTDPYALELTARVNGEVWSHGRSASIHHSFEHAIAHLSRSRTIYAGDVIGTGTVLSGSPIEIGRALADGDVVELEVEGIGVLRNRVSLPY